MNDWGVQIVKFVGVEVSVQSQVPQNVILVKQVVFSGTRVVLVVNIVLLDFIQALARRIVRFVHRGVIIC